MIAQYWKQLRCLSIGEYINKLWYTHIVEYYSAMKRNKSPIDVTTCMNLKTIMLSERSQAKKSTFHVTPFI